MTKQILQIGKAVYCIEIITKAHGFLFQNMY